MEGEPKVRVESPSLKSACTHALTTARTRASTRTQTPSSEASIYTPIRRGGWLSLSAALSLTGLARIGPARGLPGKGRAGPGLRWLVTEGRAGAELAALRAELEKLA